MFDLPDFFLQCQEIPMKLFCSGVMSFSKIYEANMSKTEFRGGHLGFLAVILDWQWVLFNPVLYLCLWSIVPILVLLSQSERSTCFCTNWLHYYINTKMFVYLFTFFSDISKMIGIPFGHKVAFYLWGCSKCDLLKLFNFFLYFFNISL